MDQGPAAVGLQWDVAQCTSLNLLTPENIGLWASHGAQRNVTLIKHARKYIKCTGRLR